MGISRISVELRLRYPISRLNVPSGFGYHPSNAPVTLWPDSRIGVIGISPGACPCIGADKPESNIAKATAMTAASETMCRPQSWKTFIGLFEIGSGLFPRRDFGLVFLIAHVGDIDPRVSHLVHGTIAKTDPLIRIGIVPVVLRIVVPGGNL